MTVSLAPRTELVTSVRFSGTLFPQTQSGRALIVSMTDEEVRALEPGDIVLRQTYGVEINAPLAPFVVSDVREGIAWEDGDQRPYNVPLACGHSWFEYFTLSRDECLYFVETDVRVPTAKALSDKNFMNWAERKGGEVKEIVTAEYDT